MDTSVSKGCFKVSNENAWRLARVDRAGPSRPIMELWSHLPREHRIREAVQWLGLLDDRTLHDLGIPHRSVIELTVRFCLDC